MTYSKLLDRFPHLKSIILDMDGVLWRDKESIGNLPDIFRRISDLDLKVILATNNATKNVSEYLEKLSGYGVTLESWQVITSAIACGIYLKEKYPAGGKLYIIGTSSLVSTLESYGFQSAKDGEPVLAVVAGLDREFNYSKLRNATVQIYKGALFVGTNPDRTFPTPEGLVPGAGSILAAIQAATYVEPTIAGKPSPLLYSIAMERLQTSPQETIAVGDRFDTDIAGGQRAGMRTALLLSGVESSDNSAAWVPEPDIIAGDLADLLN
jgi:HAD superfamily hydrolase (TIGR01450 family)